MVKIKSMSADNILSGRLTSKKLVAWCNKKFEEVEINDWVVTDIERTRFRREDYEAWAAKLYAHFDLKDKSKRSYHTRSTFLCFYSIGEYQRAIKDGYELYLKLEGGLLTSMEIDLRKIKK